MKPHDEHRIDAVFRRVSGYEVTPPDSVWNSIEKALGKKRTRLLVWLRFSAAAAILVFAILSGYYLGRQSRQVAVTPAQDTDKKAGEALSVASAPVTTLASLHNNPEKKMIPSLKRKEINRLGSDISGKEYGMEPASAETLSDAYFNEHIIPFHAIPRKEPAFERIAKPTLPGIRERLYLATLPPEEGIQVENGEKEADEFFPHFVLDGQAGPVMAYRDIHERNVTGLNNASAIKEEEPLTTYGGILKLQYYLSKRISVGTGVGYSGMGMQWKEMFSQTSYSLNGLDFMLNKDAAMYSYSGTVAGNSLGNIPTLDALNTGRITSPANETAFAEVRFIQQLGYVEVPVILKYALLDGKFGISLSTGFINHILVQNAVIMSSGGTKTSLGSTEGIRTWNLSGAAALGFDYRLSRNLRMNIEPAFKYYLNPANATGPFSTHLFSIGIYSGLSYIF